MRAFLAMEQKNCLLAVLGPTASGKTRLAIELCKAYNGEVISCDSMQIYQGMDIGTAKPSEEEKEGIPHHLLDFLPVQSRYSVADYVRDAEACFADMVKRGKLPVLCGGTGLYAHAFLYGLDFTADPGTEQMREKWAQIAKEHTPEELYALLTEKDPVAAQKIHPHNAKRVLRALEYMDATGERFSLQEERTRNNALRVPSLLFALDFHDREALYSRIDRRVEQMMQQGLLEEAKAYYAAQQGNTSCQAIGYKELLPVLNGEISAEEGIAHIQLATRHYAKRQLTWFRREKDIHWLYADDSVPLLEQAKEQVEAFLSVL